jgi:hypothetical protein
MLDYATASRVAQATQKGWKDYVTETMKSIRRIVLPWSETSKPSRSDSKMGAFFNQLSKAKGRNQVK